jgi:hypothetical protein
VFDREFHLAKVVLPFHPRASLDAPP